MKKKVAFDYIQEIISEDFDNTELVYIIDKLGEYFTYKQMKKRLEDFKLKGEIKDGRS